MSHIFPKIHSMYSAICTIEFYISIISLFFSKVMGGIV